jgi:hypothetical protein
MSTARFDTLSNAAGTSTVPVNTVVSGSAKAWVNFNGTGTVAIQAAFNVSSVTDNGIGDYTVNFTTAMPAANYAVLVTARQVADSGAGALTYGTVSWNAGVGPTTSSVRIRTINNVSIGDVENLYVAIFR